MNIEQIANIAEIFGLIVVAITLVFLTVQLRQNTKAQQIASYHTLTSYLLELDVAQASNEDLNRIITLAETSPSDVTAEEWARFTKMAYPRYGLWEYLYLLK